jgi:hypothetical protein
MLILLVLSIVNRREKRKEKKKNNYAQMNKVIILICVFKKLLNFGKRTLESRASEHVQHIIIDIYSQIISTHTLFIEEGVPAPACRTHTFTVTYT